MDNTLVERYVAAWNETDAEARAKAVAELWTEDATYTDPLADVAGHDGIAAVIAGAQGMFPGLVFTPGEVYDAHHHIARFTWHLGPADGEPVAVGFDVVELAEDGRIRRVLGFLDRVPAA
ncbi:nuclear transport factor 2 family protein [Nonomuraea wenchangensis]